MAVWGLIWPEEASTVSSLISDMKGFEWDVGMRVRRDTHWAIGQRVLFIYFSDFSKITKMPLGLLNISRPV